MRPAEELAALMASSAYDPRAQARQTRFRRALVDDWQIAPGARVLEIGCGQGDTTAVLADAVGPGGRVTAVDPADPGYGEPVTIGASMRVLAEGPLGDRIDVRIPFDVLDPASAFAEDAFDVVVLALCTWYFASLDEIAETLRRVRLWAPRLCLAEWELEPAVLEQTGHLLAVLIRGQREAGSAGSDANVRTPYVRDRLHGLLGATGWRVVRETLVDTSELDDGRWEIESCLDEAPGEPVALDVLRRLYERGSTRSLPAYSVVAERA
jgi:SAM-dependent methyltransferase